MQQRAPEPERPTRLVPRRGDRRIRRLGLTRNPFEDLYHKALEIPWWAFLLATSATYLGGNVVFAAIYLLQPGSIDKARAGSVIDAFFFSVQTMATIGYGVMAPATVFANCVVTLETLFGMILLAMVTGLVFTRFSRPTARVLFSNVAVVAPFDGQPMLMLRMGNQRSNQILQAEVSLLLLRDEVTAEGIAMRRFHDLALVRRSAPAFALTFHVMHPLDAASPLAGLSPDKLLEGRAELVVTVTGLDETLSQVVHARQSYLGHEIRFGHRFVDVIEMQADGGRTIDFARFHHTEPLGDGAYSAAVRI